MLVHGGHPPALHISDTVRDIFSLGTASVKRSVNMEEEIESEATLRLDAQQQQHDDLASKMGTEYVWKVSWLRKTLGIEFEEPERLAPRLQRAIAAGNPFHVVRQLQHTRAFGWLCTHKSPIDESSLAWQRREHEILKSRDQLAHNRRLTKLQQRVIRKTLSELEEEKRLESELDSGCGSVNHVSNCRCEVCGVPNPAFDTHLAKVANFDKQRDTELAAISDRQYGGKKNKQRKKSVVSLVAPPMLFEVGEVVDTFMGRGVVEVCNFSSRCPPTYLLRHSCLLNCITNNQTGQKVQQHYVVVRWNLRPGFAVANPG
jgi:hypothetical protein